MRITSIMGQNGMQTITKNSVLLSEEEYQKLTNPDKTYTLVTKTSARKVVDKLLKHFNANCWLDDPEIDYDDWCCSACPVYSVLGDEGGRLCLRQKAWSK